MIDKINASRFIDEYVKLCKKHQLCVGWDVLHGNTIYEVWHGEGGWNTADYLRDKLRRNAGLTEDTNRR